MSLVVWSVTPAADHTPTVFETLQDHLTMIAEHGHSHGFAEDLFWALHGHSHDAADHEHSKVFLVLGPATRAVSYRDTWHLPPASGGDSRVYRIERPPRA